MASKITKINEFAYLTSNRSLTVLTVTALVLLLGSMLAGHVPKNIVPVPEQPTAPNASQTDGTIQSRDELPSSQPYRTSRGKPAAKANPPSSAIAASIPQPAGSRHPTEKYVTINNKQYPLRTYEPMLTPDDPSATQWWTTNAKLTQAWDTTPPAGDQATVLAVIDTGFALKHEEFVNRWYTNPGESGPAGNEQPSQLNCTDRGLPFNTSCNLIDEDADGIVDNETGGAIYQNPSRLNCTDQGLALSRSCNRIDDDQNGYVDDVSGWDFANNDNSPQAGELNPYGSGTRHGTQVAGVAAATGNNTKGIAGVDWQTKILPIQALDDDSYGDTLGVGRAILYAAAQGADVISLSLGSDLPDEYVREAIRTATAAGSVVVAAAGNSGCDCMVYPANYPEVVAVGALDTGNQPAGFSSYGANLDILAPGTQMLTTSWLAANQTGAYTSGVNGTSFATPLVSGLLTRLLRQQPSAKPLQLIAALTENTSRLTLPAGTIRSNTLGFGSVDAAKATSRMTTSRSPAQRYSLSPVSTGAYLSPQSPAEAAGNYMIQLCEEDGYGATPLYELTKPGTRLFTVSPTEAWLAGRDGYQTSYFAGICLSQPHDRPQVVRAINMYKEFRNLDDHYPQ